MFRYVDFRILRFYSFMKIVFNNNNPTLKRSKPVHFKTHHIWKRLKDNKIKAVSVIDWK